MKEESEQEKKRSKTKKVGKSGTKLIPKTELTEGSPLAQRVEEPSPSDPPARVKASKKRKRSGVALEGSETNPAEPKSRKHKKRDKIREKDQMCHPSYPAPAADESLSEPSRKALSYTYERWRGIEAWKFNKARQNWLLRNIWSEQAIPESYVGLVIDYLAGIKGGAREQLVEECISKTSTEKASMQSAKTSEDGSEDRSKIVDGGASRAQSLLYALRKTTGATDLSNCPP
ncbi:hypothetical protein JVU11DRAFT_1468 [Chiua virens]|nr:hypothetical protein JVU11DRAFT_1468 [Chiua virens]